MSHTHPKTEVVVGVDVVVAGGGTGVPSIIVEGTAAHHAVDVTSPYSCLWLHCTDERRSLQ